MTDNEPHLTAWLGRAHELAQRARLPEAGAELTRIGAHAYRDVFRLAVISDVVRERVRLTNTVIDRAVLPRNVTADVPVLVVAGEHDALEVDTGHGWSQAPLPEHGPWWDDVAPVRGAKRTIKNWTPGVEVLATSWPMRTDGMGADTQVAAVESADAALVPTMATAVLTRDEQDRLALLRRAGMLGDRVLVLLTRLDLVDEEEREDVLAEFTRRAAAVAPDLVIVVEQPGVAPGGLVRDWLDGVRRDGASSRTDLVVHRLIGCLERTADIAIARSEAAATARVEWRRTAKAAATQLNDELRVFDEVREQLRTSRLGTLDWLRRERVHFRTTAFEALSHQVGRSEDPKRWCETELKYRLEELTARWVRHVEQGLRNHAATHSGIVTTAFETRLGLTVTPTAALDPGSPPAVEPGYIELVDARKRRFRYRALPTGLALLAATVMPGIGPVATLTASLAGLGLGEFRLRGLVEEQRAAVRAHLARLLDRVVEDGAAGLTTRIDSVYDQFGSEIARMRDEWRDHPTRDVPPEEEPTPDWSAIAADVDELIATIRTGTETEEIA